MYRFFVLQLTQSIGYATDGLQCYSLPFLTPRCGLFKNNTPSTNRLFETEPGNILTRRNSMPIAPVDDEDTVLYYEDSGVPDGSVDYATVVLIHGMLFHGGE